ncbi:MAG: haloalkane dehalogenase [Myxococcota bacterium]
MPPWNLVVRRARVAALGLSLTVAATSCAVHAPPAEPSAFARAKQRVTVEGVEMAYIERGAGRPIVFLHGNPTSSYLWRNVWPHAEPHGRVLAPDLVGMGDSAKLPPRTPDGADGRYRFVEHRRYLEAFLAAVSGDDDVVLVVHDWGSALGFDWARRYPERVRGIAHMEAILRPARFGDMAFSQSLLFRAMRGGLGEWLILRRNFFVDSLVPRLVMRELSEAELAEYRAPYRAAGEDRRPTLTWPREIPIDGTPEDTLEIVEANLAYLQDSQTPKLFVRAEPGALVRGKTVELARGFPNQTETVVAGLHYVQEDSPDAIGEALSAWLETLP